MGRGGLSFVVAQVRVGARVEEETTGGGGVGWVGGYVGRGLGGLNESRTNGLLGNECPSPTSTSSPSIPPTPTPYLAASERPSMTAMSKGLDPSPAAASIATKNGAWASTGVSRRKERQVTCPPAAAWCSMDHFPRSSPWGSAPWAKR